MLLYLFFILQGLGVTAAKADHYWYFQHAASSSTEAVEPGSHIRLLEQELHLDLDSLMPVPIEPTEVAWTGFLSENQTDITTMVNEQPRYRPPPSYRRQRILTTLRLDFLDGVIGYMRTFINNVDRFDDRYYYNFRNFRVQLQHLLMESQTGSPHRLFFHGEILRYDNLSAMGYRVFGVGAGLRYDINFPDRRNLNMSFSVLPFYAESRRSTYLGQTVDSDFFGRMSAGMGLSTDLSSRVGVNILMSIQPHWRDYRDFRAYQEIYLKINFRNDERSRLRYRITDIAIVPRIIHWHITDLDRTPIRLYRPALGGAGLDNTMLFVQPGHEVVIMQSLQFHFQYQR